MQRVFWHVDSSCDHEIERSALRVVLTITIKSARVFREACAGWRKNTMPQPTLQDATLLLQLSQLAASNGISEASNFMWSDKFIPDYDKFNQAFPAGSHESGMVRKIAVHYETIGTLWKHGLINEDLLFDQLLVRGVWNRLSGHVLGARAQMGEPALGENFEAMALANDAWMRTRHTTATMTNKALVRRFYEDLNRHNLSALDQYIAPDFVDRTPSPGSPTNMPGIDGIRKSLDERQKAFPDCHYAIEDIVGEGDEVSARVTFTGTHTGAYFDVQPTSKKVRVTSLHILRFSDGKTIENWDFGESLREQLGAAKVPVTSAANVGP